MGTEARKIYDDWILVAPYWNLNKDFVKNVRTCSSILVAPYWNLNTEVTAPKPRTVKILVAPYWNLNG